jgi:RNA polymerase sigma-70 factor, ECF subfamily
MVVQPRPGWRDPGHRPRRPAPATTAPRPPGGAVVASLRGAFTAVRARHHPHRGMDRSRSSGFVVDARCRRSDSGPVRTTHVHSAGRAELPPLADEDLVERARTDPDAFAELYRRYVNRVHAFVYRRSRSTEIADEITSATFERALRALPGFRWREGGFQAWLYRIAANELASHYRRAQRQHSERGQRAARQLHEASTAVEHPLDNDEGDLVLQALGRLNERYQRAITLRYLTGLSPEEAAHAMGLNKATLAVVLHRALGALRKAMHELERDARRSAAADDGTAAR